jgi:hypothetical protein
MRLRSPKKSIYQCRFGSAQGVRAELERVEADARDPLTNQASILTYCEALAVATTTCEQELARLPAVQSEILIDRLPRLLGELEPDRRPVFFWRTVARSSV